MSGNDPTTVRLVGPQSFRLLNSVDEVHRRLGPFVLVGGLAVLSRLSSPHRATEDLDALHRRSPHQVPGVELLMAASGAERVDAVGVRLPIDEEAIRVDVLEAIPEHGANPSDDPTDRLHVSSYLWAFETATPMLIVTSDGRDTISREVQVATPGALVAMKFKAAVDDRPRAEEATDVLDILRLTSDPATFRDVDVQLGSMEPAMAGDLWLHVNRKFVTERARTIRVLYDVLHLESAPDQIDDAAVYLDHALRKRA